MRAWASAQAAVAALALAFAAVPADSPAALRQLPGDDGCVAAIGSPACLPSEHSTAGIAFAHGGRHAFVVSGRGVEVLERGPTGNYALSPGARCIGGSGCTAVRGIRDPAGLAVSPDSRHLYVVSGDEYDLTIVALRIARATGALTPLPGSTGCVSTRRQRGCGALLAAGAVSTLAAAVSPDGRNIYVPLRRGRVAVVSRDVRTGAIRPLRRGQGCGGASPSVCRLGSAGDWPSTDFVLPSRDGRSVFAAGSGWIVLRPALAPARSALPPGAACSRRASDAARAAAGSRGSPRSPTAWSRSAEAGSRWWGAARRSSSPCSRAGTVAASLKRMARPAASAPAGVAARCRPSSPTWRSKSAQLPRAGTDATSTSSRPTGSSTCAPSRAANCAHADARRRCAAGTLSSRTRRTSR